MFHTVSGNSWLNNVTGIYGGYINGYICSGTTCAASNSTINVTMREVSGIGLSYNVYNYIDGYGYSEYVCSYSYQGKLNGTKATFNDYNTSTTSVAISLLDDAKIV